MSIPHRLLLKTRGGDKGARELSRQLYHGRFNAVPRPSQPAPAAPAPADNMAKAVRRCVMYVRAGHVSRATKTLV